MKNYTQYLRRHAAECVCCLCAMVPVAVNAGEFTLAVRDGAAPLAPVARVEDANPRPSRVEMEAATAVLYSAAPAAYADTSRAIRPR